MKEFGETMPFDGKRMIVAGFAPIVQEGDAGEMGYTDGFIVPVSTLRYGLFSPMVPRN